MSQSSASTPANTRVTPNRCAPAASSPVELLLRRGRRWPQGFELCRPWPYGLISRAPGGGAQGLGLSGLIGREVLRLNLQAAGSGSRGRKTVDMIARSNSQEEDE